MDGCLSKRFGDNRRLLEFDTKAEMDQRVKDS